MLYFSENTQAFYDDSINSQMPEDVVSITQEQHAILLTAINSGCHVSSDLTVSTPKPDKYHVWQDGAWFISDSDKQAQLSDVKTQVQATLDTALQIALTANFTSQALGQTHTYPCSDTDQRNLMAVAWSGINASLYCNDGVKWAMVKHTSAQIKQVVSDWQMAVQTAQAKYADLTDTLTNATDITTVQGVTW